MAHRRHVERQTGKRPCARWDAYRGVIILNCNKK